MNQKEFNKNIVKTLNNIMERLDILEAKQNERYQHEIEEIHRLKYLGIDCLGEKFKVEKLGPDEEIVPLGGDEIIHSIGQLIRYLRRSEKRLTLGDVADATGKKVSAISELENCTTPIEIVTWKPDPRLIQEMSEREEDD